MRKQVRDHLIDEYDSLKVKCKFTALKYRFVHNEVNVNIYFDNYDGIPSMSIILSYKNKYYYTSLNINNTKVRTEYLKKIPSDILEKLLDDNKHLNAFFEDIEEHILNNEKTVVNYKKDTCFTNTMKYSRSRKDLPFLYSLRKVKMSNDTLERLSETMSIDRSVLKNIQSQGLTVVRTDDVDKRKSLVAIIKGYTIKI